MTKDQRKLYDSIRNMFHDEKHDCTNLAKMIPVLFPEGEGDDITTEILNSLVSILEARAELGARIMDIIYDLEGD